VGKDITLYRYASLCSYIYMYIYLYIVGVQLKNAKLHDFFFSLTKNKCQETDRGLVKVILNFIIENHKPQIIRRRQKSLVINIFRL